MVSQMVLILFKLSLRTKDLHQIHCTLGLVYITWGRPNQGTSSLRRLLSTFWAISIQVGDTSTYLEKASLKISKYFYIPTVGWILVKSLFSESTRMLASKYWAEEYCPGCIVWHNWLCSGQRCFFFSLFFQRMVGFDLSNYMAHWFISTHKFWKRKEGNFLFSFRLSPGKLSSFPRGA